MNESAHRYNDLTRGLSCATPSQTSRGDMYISTFLRDRQGCGSILSGLFLPLVVLILGIGCTVGSERPDQSDILVGRPATSPSTSTPRQTPGALWYRIAPREGSIQITVRLLNPPDQTTFFLPGPWAGQDDFDSQILLGTATGSEGSLPLTLDRTMGRIDVETRAEAYVELNYRIETSSQEQRSSSLHPWSDSQGFFAYAPTSLILPSAGLAAQLHQIPVEIHLPADWTAISTWPVETIRDTGTQQMIGYLVDDVRDLRDAFFGAGSQWYGTIHSMPWNGTFTLVTAGPSALNLEALTSAGTALFTHYYRYFGTYEHLSGIILAVDPASSLELRGMGRRGGFVLEIPSNHPLDDETLILLAHEAFHSWNGHQLVPDPASESELEWFKEGLTHYLALKTLHHLGLLTERIFRRELARAGQNYLQNPITTGRPARPIDQRRLPYDRGVLIALALDASLYAASDGSLAIEDWLRLLLTSDYARAARNLTPDVLEESFLTLTGPRISQLHNQYRLFVDNPDTLDVEAIFSRAGLHFLAAGNGTPARALPLRPDSLFHELFEPKAPYAKP